MSLLFHYTYMGTLYSLQIEAGYVGRIRFLFNNINLHEEIVMPLEQILHICKQANAIEIHVSKLLISFREPLG